MKAHLQKEYQNIADTINVFQLVGNARDVKQTLSRNINRIVQFYYFSVPELTSKDIKALSPLLTKFYETANYYHCQNGFADFIVPTFNVIHNQEWVTIVQFIAFLQSLLNSDSLSNVNKSILQELINASRSIKETYYSRHTHTMVNQQRFNQIIKTDFN